MKNFNFSNEEDRKQFKSMLNHFKKFQIILSQI